MAVKMPETDETEMNMTPMIDIVFQLIVFFLLTLRFKEPEQQIASELPKDRGMVASVSQPVELTTIRVNLFRQEIGQDSAHTKVRVGNRSEIRLPPSKLPTGGPEAVKAWERLYRARVDDVITAIKAVKDLQEGADIKGEIATPAPFGNAVPHGDVMRIVDAFMSADITDVKFEGSASPLPATGSGRE